MYRGVTKQLTLNSPLHAKNHMNILSDIKQALHTFIQTSYPTNASLPAYTVTLNVDESRTAFGDLSTNAALILAKAVQRNPREIAQKIVTNFSHPAIAKIELAGPGFLNIFLTPTALQQLAVQLLDHGTAYFKPDQLDPRYTINLEFVSANPTGPLHFGHGRGGIIGDVLARILRFVGHQVSSEFYINDAGAQIVKLGISFKIRCQQLLGATVELPEDAYHGAYLTELAQEYISQYGQAGLEKSDEFLQQYAKEHLLARIQITLTN